MEAEPSLDVRHENHVGNRSINFHRAASIMLSLDAAKFLDHGFSQRVSRRP